MDVDADSTACAQENFERNQVRSVAVAIGTLDIVPAERQFDVVMANIQADILCGVAPRLPSRMKAGGRAILSGLLLRDAEPVLGLFRDAGFELIRRQDEGDWAALELRLRAAA